MIDFHMLVTRDINTFEANNNFLRLAEQDLRAIDNRGKSVLYGRTKAYNETDDSHVSFIDDDDFTMLNKRHIEEIIALDKDALFTNSLFVTYKAWIPLCNTSITEYKKRYEDVSDLCPHQTIVLNRALALDLLKEVSDILKQKGWCENTTDYVLRLLISKKELWYYYPKITYKWVNQSNGLHTTQVSLNNEIRKYFKHLKLS